MSITKTAFPESTWGPVLKKTGERCTYCGKALSADLYDACSPIPSPEGAWEVDHWTPKSFFKNAVDADVPENLWPACCGCNDEKRATTGEAYISKRKAESRPTNTSVVVTKRYEQKTKGA